MATEQNDIVWTILDEGFKYSAEHCGSIPANKSLMGFFRERVEASNLQEHVKKNLLQIVQMWGAMIGTEIERQSFRYFWLEKVIDGGTHTLLIVQAILILSNL